MASFIRITVLVWANILAGYALWVLMTYLTNVWSLNLTHAAAIVNVFTGTAMIMPIGMTFLVDAFMGDYCMLLFSSLAYCFGLSFLAMSTPPVLSQTAGNCSDYQPDCIGNTQKVMFYTALALIAVGLSGHITSLKSFLAYQTQVEIEIESETESDQTERKKLWQFAGAFAMVLAIIGGIGLPYIHPWSVRFGIPAICTVVATLLFLSGSCSYKHARPSGRLCRVTEVEETKIILRMIPMWMALIICGVVSSIGNTYFLEQANHMNRKVGRLKVPLPILLIFYDMAKHASTKFYDKIAVTLVGEGSRKFAASIGYVVAMILAILCCITAAKVETRRLDVIKSHDLLDKPEERIPMTIFWLLPQFLLLGALDGISTSSVKFFFIEQVSPSLKRYLLIFTASMLGAGNLGSALSV